MRTRTDKRAEYICELPRKVRLGVAAQAHSAFFGTFPVQPMHLKSQSDNTNHNNASSQEAPPTVPFSQQLCAYQRTK